MKNSRVPGFSGNYREPATGAYPLGNGYRFYLPQLMRFNSPDGWSPFYAGGANPYTYCDADPINLSDPSGHAPIGLISKITDAASTVEAYVRANAEAESIAAREARRADEFSHASALESPVSEGPSHAVHQAQPGDESGSRWTTATSRPFKKVLPDGVTGTLYPPPPLRDAEVPFGERARQSVHFMAYTVNEGHRLESFARGGSPFRDVLKQEKRFSAALKSTRKAIKATEAASLNSAARDAYAPEAMQNVRNAFREISDEFARWESKSNARLLWLRKRLT